jgi:hypothetical protein
MQTGLLKTADTSGPIMPAAGYRFIATHGGAEPVCSLPFARLEIDAPRVSV